MTGTKLAGELEIRLLGGFEVLVDGKLADGIGQHRRAGDLVKMLALTPTHRLHREQLADRLWPHLEADAAFANLHKAACLARKALGTDAIVLRRGWVELGPGASVTTDLERFEADADRALASGDPAACARAAAGYSGELLPDDLYAEWANERRERLRRRHIELLRRAHRWEELVACEPTDEEAQRELILAYAKEGRRNDALRQLQRLHDALVQLGLDPSPETRELHRLLSRQAAARAPLSQTPPLMSREPELARALTMWREAARGRGGTLLVAGEAGIGKTHFCERFLAVVAKEGGSTLRGTAYRAEGMAPYAPVAEALNRLLLQCPDLEQTLSAGARPALTRLLGRFPTADPPVVGRQPILSAVTQLLAAAAKEHAVVLWIDDLHAADDATVQLVHYLSRMARLEPLLLVASYRQEALTPAAEDVRTSLLAGRAAIELTLGPLPLAATDAIVNRVAGRPPGEAAVAAIHARAEGNPFFVEELATAIGPDGTLEIPRRLYEILDARLQSLDAQLRSVLERVAIAGAFFSADDVGALTGLDELGASEALELALRSGFVVESAEGCRFRHGLLREALLASLPRHRRQAGHRQVAGALAAAGASPGRVAHHLLEGGRGADALPWLERAAREAAAVGAVADARALTERALEQAPHRSSLLELRAECLFASGDRAAITAYGEAIAAARGDRRRRLRIRRARVAVLLGDLDTAAGTLEGMVGSGGVEKVRLLVARGYAAWHEGDLDEAERSAEEARRIAIADELAAELTDVATLRALVAHSRGDWQQQIEVDLLDTSRAPQLAAKVHDGHLCVVEIYLYGGEPYERIAAFARELREVAQRNGAERGRAFATVVLGEAELLAGNLDEAVVHLREGAELHRRIGSAGGEALALQRLAEAAVLTGQPAEARALLAQALDLARQSRLLARHLLQRIYGTMILAAPSRAAALAVVDDAEFSIVGPREECRMCVVTLAVPAARACAEAGELARARAYLDQARESATMLWHSGAWHAAVVEVEGTLAAAEGRPEVAMARLGEAADLFDRAGQPLDAQRCRVAAGAESLRKVPVRSDP